MPIRISAAVLAAACIIGCDNEETASAGAPDSSGRAPVGVAVAEEAPDLGAASDQQARKRWDRPPEMQIDPSKSYVATIKTNQGDIKIALFAKDAPKTVNSFVFLAKNDFYDGTIFHRVINNFMIQGGDPTGTGTGGPGYQFEDETRNNPNKHEPFTLSMANAGPNTNGSQFFITEGSTPHLDGRHTVFGRVVEGKEVVEKISDLRTDARDRPAEDVVIQDVAIEEKAAEPASKPAE